MKYILFGTGFGIGFFIVVAGALALLVVIQSCVAHKKHKKTIKEARRK